MVLRGIGGKGDHGLCVHVCSLLFSIPLPSRTAAHFSAFKPSTAPNYMREISGCVRLLATDATALSIGVAFWPTSSWVAELPADALSSGGG